MHKKHISHTSGYNAHPHWKVYSMHIYLQILIYASEPCRCDHDGVNEHDISITMLIKNLPPLKQQLSFCIVWICTGWYISTVARFLLMVWKLFHVCYNAHSAQKIKHIFMLGAKYAQNWHSLDRPSVQHSCSPDGIMTRGEQMKRGCCLAGLW